MKAGSLRIPAFLLVCFIVAPLIGLAVRGSQALRDPSLLTSPIVLEALRISALTCSSAMIVIIVTGTPLAYLLARRSIPMGPIINTIIDLPIVLPPVVAGLSLLLAFGRIGLIGRNLDMVGIQIGFTTFAVVLAQIFVAAPLYIKSARAGFESVDTRLEQVALTLGASPLRTFMRITLPLSAPSLTAGLALALARALGEFGATLMFAGNLPGITQTMPLGIMTLMESDLNSALAIAVILLAISCALLGCLRLFGLKRKPFHA